MIRSSCPLLLAAALLPACAACPDNAPPPLAGCAIPVLGWTDSTPLEGGVDVMIEDGTVSEVGEGADPAGCFDGQYVGDAAADGAIWLRAEQTDGTEWIVALSVPNLEASTLPGVGDPIRFQYAYSHGDFGPDIVSLTVWPGEDDHVAWVGEADDLMGLRGPPGLETRRGEAECEGRDSCGSWERYSFDVSFRGEDQQVVPWGATAELAGRRFVHGGWELSYDTSTNCQDWFVADVQAALIAD